MTSSRVSLSNEAGDLGPVETPGQVRRQGVQIEARCPLRATDHAGSELIELE